MTAQPSFDADGNVVIAPVSEWTDEGLARLKRYLTTPGLLEQEMDAENAAAKEAWNADPLYVIRSLRAHGVEPSEGALNTLDGPAICERCGATDCEDGEQLHPTADICYGCGHVVCDRDSCDTPPNTRKHTFEQHGAKVTA